MKAYVLFLFTILLLACEEQPKDYVTLSGTISNKNSDSLVIRTRTFHKVIKVANNGTFEDTLNVETDIYNVYDGTESTSIFLKNGFELNLTLDTKAFDETIKYEGKGAEHSNFLAEATLLREQLLDIDELSTLAPDLLDRKFEEIESELNEFYESKTTIDSSIVQKYAKQVDPMLQYYKKYIHNTRALKTELAKGKVSPTFEGYENYNGGTTSLSDLKGKYTYIDVWATWCGPCKAEIPALKELEKEYNGKNIQFVSLSIDDDKAHGGSWEKARKNWKTMVSNKELGGIQLIAPEGWKSEFVRAYKISGIPRFILIDPNGNIVSPDAPRPSSSKLKKLFEELSI